MYGTSGSNGVVLITTKSGAYRSGITPPLSVSYKFAYGLNTQSYKYKTSDFISANDANAIIQRWDSQAEYFKCIGRLKFTQILCFLR